MCAHVTARHCSARVEHRRSRRDGVDGTEKGLSSNRNDEEDDAKARLNIYFNVVAAIHQQHVSGIVSQYASHAARSDLKALLKSVDSALPC